MSLNFGKKEVKNYLAQNFPEKSTILDVGAYNGKWFKVLNSEGRYEMDAVEIFAPSIERYKLREKYSQVYNEDILDFVKNHPDKKYDIIIMGDVLEHIMAEDGMKLVKELYPLCKELIIAVPFNSKRHAHYGNEHERHLQTDLNAEIFDQRYPGFELLCFKKLHNFTKATGYAYYKKANKQ